VKLIVGLGNPGIEYQFSPHNVGFLAVDRIASDLGVEVRNRQCRALTARAVIGGESVLLAKPETFMNLSGLSVRELVEEYEAKPESDLIVIQDELDFPLGTLRIHTRRSSAGHNGMESIIGALDTQDFSADPNRGSAGAQGRRRRTLFAGAHAQGGFGDSRWNTRYCRRSRKDDFAGRRGSGDEPL
jgi:peptidyl-tRNA hydrolase